MTVKHVKIYGERNTGTNVLKKLIEENSASQVLPSVTDEVMPAFRRIENVLARIPHSASLQDWCGDMVFRNQPPGMTWKHAATHFDDPSAFSDCLVLLLTRHPASWLLALHRHPYHIDLKKSTNLPVFLEEEFSLLGRDRLKCRTITPPHLWNSKMESYLTFIDQMEKHGIRHRVLKFEDLVTDQATVFSSIDEQLIDPARQISIVEKSTKDDSKNYEYYRNYYGNSLWATEIDEQSRNIIGREIDWKVAGQFHYDKAAILPGRT